MQGVSDGYKHGASSFFAMYRFDFMLDQQLRPYIMEVTCFHVVTCLIICSVQKQSKLKKVDLAIAMLVYVDQFVVMCALTVWYM